MNPSPLSWLARTGCVITIGTALMTCGESEISPADKNFEPTDWTDASHGNDIDPNYAVAFDQEKVKTIHLTFTADDWTKVNEDMKERTGNDFGTSGGKPAGGNGPVMDLVPGDPIYVSAAFSFEEKSWYKVGFRLKGNSSLSSSWRQGVYKLPFRLNFDRFEEDYPQIKNQRFYGFKELSFSPGAKDNSLIREKAGADIMLAAGIPAARTAFYQVYIDFGQGEKYCGVYTMVEVIDDTMVSDQFGEKEGNIYKPESRFQVFNTTEFEKKNNETANDFGDVQQFVLALNASTVDRAAWRSQLESTFDVDHFLKWLAVNTAMVNWDSYGVIAHNYYLYHHPQNGLTWIPWDHNEAMNGRGGSGNMQGSLTLDLKEVSATWPLIRRLMDDPQYTSQYRDHVKNFSENVFTPEKMNALFDHHTNLISRYVVGPDAVESGKYSQLSPPTAFSAALPALKDHVVSRKQAVNSFLK